MNQLLGNQECVACARVKKEDFWISTRVLKGEDTLGKNEIEIKFYVPNRFEEIRTKVNEMSILQHFKREFENNLRFDNRRGSLRLKGAVLRLRSWWKTTLTYKGPVKPDSEFKERDEIEVEVNDFRETKTIPEKLGFHCFMRYEKRREVFHVGEVEVCFDELPYGNFVEIEGSRGDIRNMAKRLGFQWENRIVADYIKIFDGLRVKRNSGFRDLTFKNFEKIDTRVLDFASFILRYYGSACTAEAKQKNREQRSI